MNNRKPEAVLKIPRCVDCMTAIYLFPQEHQLAFGLVSTEALQSLEVTSLHNLTCPEVSPASTGRSVAK